MYFFFFPPNHKISLQGASCFAFFFFFFRSTPLRWNLEPLDSFFPELHPIIISPPILIFSTRKSVRLYSAQFSICNSYLKSLLFFHSFKTMFQKSQVISCWTQHKKQPALTQRSHMLKYYTSHFHKLSALSTFFVWQFHKLSFSI